jgi:hypothetical protein
MVKEDEVFWEWSEGKNWISYLQNEKTTIERAFQEKKESVTIFDSKYKIFFETPMKQKNLVTSFIRDVRRSIYLENTKEYHLLNFKTNFQKASMNKDLKKKDILDQILSKITIKKEVKGISDKKLKNYFFYGKKPDNLDEIEKGFWYLCSTVGPKPSIQEVKDNYKDFEKWTKFQLPSNGSTPVSSPLKNFSPLNLKRNRSVFESDQDSSEIESKKIKLEEKNTNHVELIISLNTPFELFPQLPQFTSTDDLNFFYMILCSQLLQEKKFKLQNFLNSIELIKKSSRFKLKLETPCSFESLDSGISLKLDENKMIVLVTSESLKLEIELLQNTLKEEELDNEEIVNPLSKEDSQIEEEITRNWKITFYDPEKKSKIEGVKNPFEISVISDNFEKIKTRIQEDAYHGKDIEFFDSKTKAKLKDEDISKKLTNNELDLHCSIRLSIPEVDKINQTSDESSVLKIYPKQKEIGKILFQKIKEMSKELYNQEIHEKFKQFDFCYIVELLYLTS